MTNRRLAWVWTILTLLTALLPSTLRAQVAPEWVRQMPRHTNAVASVAFSPDGRLLASGSWDRTVRLWDAATDAEVRALRGHTDDVRRATAQRGGSTARWTRATL